MDLTSEEAIGAVRGRLEKAEAVTVLTGAGVSADSGVPTFRGESGLWRNFRAEDLATPVAFERNPRLVWEWYNWRREKIAGCSPNPAHAALASMENLIPGFTLITQNVDGLHRSAGSRKLIEIHGNIWRVRCLDCRRITENREVPIPILPSCVGCRGRLRPDVVWFGESLDPEDIRRSLRAVQSSELLLIIGTSGVVQPAASFATIAKQSGAYVVEINIESTPGSHTADTVLIGRAAEVVPRLLPG
jgi:NAD-dependent deacetylase